jgi:hypothetical protein
MRWPTTLFLLAVLAACQQQASAPKIKGDEVQPGQVEVAGLTYCGAARLELAAIVLNGAPRGASLDDVHDATAPGCTWVANDGNAWVRLNVYDGALLSGAQPAEAFERLAARHAVRGEAVELPDVGARAARFGFTDAKPEDGIILVETADAVLELEGRSVSPAKLAIFARGVSENVNQPQG